jgi:hypothetical protein
VLDFGVPMACGSGLLLCFLKKKKEKEKEK